jgi:AcrR family transcriptional regulator
MRALASALGTGPMTLYNHVRDRDDLEALVVDAVLEELRVPSLHALDWRDAVLQLSTAMWLGIRAHPRIVPLVVMRRGSPSSAEARALGDALVCALHRGGYRAKSLRAAVRAVTAFIAGFALAEFHGPLRDGSVSARQLTREFRAGINALLSPRRDARMCRSCAKTTSGGRPISRSRAGAKR